MLLITLCNIKAINFYFMVFVILCITMVDMIMKDNIMMLSNKKYITHVIFVLLFAEIFTS